MSVVLCCHNSAARLPDTLLHLARQRLDGPWEVVLVDNGSVDDTRVVAQRAWEGHGRPAELRIVEEPVPGLARARDAGIGHARFETVVFCDDDNWLDPGFLRIARSILEERPDVGVAGGRSEAHADLPLPSWFDDHAVDYAVGAQGAASGDVTGRGYLWGAGMVLRRSVYLCMRKAGAQSLLTDRTGVRLSSGNDTEICMWHVLAGYRLWYDSRLALKHYLTSDRLTEEYRERLAAGLRSSWAAIASYSLVAEAISGPRPGWKRLLHALLGLGRNPGSRPTLQAFLPLPVGEWDPVTKRIQRMARSLRRSCPAPSLTSRCPR